MTALIHHVVRADRYRALREDEPYVPDGFAQEGFIHCTQDAALMAVVASRVFGREPGEFLVLVIDPDRLTAELRFEPPAPPPESGSALEGVLFPHIYGPLNREAIVEVRPAARAADGRFIST